MFRTPRLLRSVLVVPGVAALALAACSPSDSADTTVELAASTQQTSSAEAAATATTAARSTSVTASTATTASTGSRTVALSDVAAAVLAEHATYHDVDADLVWAPEDEVAVTLQGGTATADGAGVQVNGSTVTITQAGTYRIDGSLTGQLVVAADGEGVVRLVLDGATIASATGAAIDVQAAERVVVVAEAGTTSVLTDAPGRTPVTDASDERSAALFSMADLAIAGTGTLEVHGTYRDGIGGKDDVIVSGASVVVEAVDDGVRGKDALVLLGATVRVDAGGDALKSDDEEDPTRGYVLVNGGTIDLTAGADGIDAITDVVLAGATITLTATDDGVHSNDTVLADSGTLTVDAGDDALHADARLAIEDATVDITASFEGLEANTLDIAGGSVTVRSSDDGINASGADPTLRISGGTTRIDAGGDGVDVNGSITMTGGTLLVDGPKANMNGALDYDGTFDISGGVVVATGSSGMAMAPGSSSAQRSLLGTFGTQQAGTLVHVVAADGTPIVTFAPSKAYQSLAVSTPAVADGLTYQVVLGGTAAGSADFGLYAAADHSGGSVALTTTTAEAVSRTMGPGGGPGAR